MNIDSPDISRRLGKLMTTMNIPRGYQDEFLKEAFKAKDMDTFVKDLNSGKFFNNAT